MRNTLKTDFKAQVTVRLLDGQKSSIKYILNPTGLCWSSTVLGKSMQESCFKVLTGVYQKL